MPSTLSQRLDRLGLDRLGHKDHSRVRCRFCRRVFKRRTMEQTEEARDG